jgi:hypothetical protein
MSESEEEISGEQVKIEGSGENVADEAADSKLDKLDDNFCETFARMKIDGVEFTLNDSEKLFESNFLVDFAVHFQEKSLKPPIINALQKVVNALGSILHICVEILVYSVLSDEEFIEMIDFNKIRAKAIENSIYKYIIKHKEDKNLLVMASPYQEAIFTAKHDLYDMQVPLCKDKIVEEEKIELDALKFDPPTSGGAFGVLKKKLMDFFEEGLSIALESSFNTEAFGGIVEKWSSHKDTKELFRQQFNRIKLEGGDKAIDDCKGDDKNANTVNSDAVGDETIGKQVDNASEVNAKDDIVPDQLGGGEDEHNNASNVNDDNKNNNASDNSDGAMNNNQEKSDSHTDDSKVNNDNAVNAVNVVDSADNDAASKEKKEPNANAGHFKKFLCDKADYFIPSQPFTKNVKYKR